MDDTVEDGLIRLDLGNKCSVDNHLHEHKVFFN